MNNFQSTGILMSMNLPNEADAKRGRHGMIVVRYGPRRDKKSKSPRQFVNAVPMRVPSKLVKNFRDHSIGSMVEVVGRLEGVMESTMGGHHHSVQLVANVIREIEMGEFGFSMIPVGSGNTNKPPVGAIDADETHTGEVEAANEDADAEAASA